METEREGSAGEMELPIRRRGGWHERADRSASPVVEADDALVAAAQTDLAAFAQLYRRYLTPVYQFCFRRLGSQAAAEDAKRVNI